MSEIEAGVHSDAFFVLLKGRQNRKLAEANELPRKQRKRTMREP
jgi:hypothetical protein